MSAETSIRNGFSKSKRWSAPLLLLTILTLLLSSTLYGDDSFPQMQLTDLDRQVIKIFNDNCTTAGCHGASAPQLGLKLTEDAFLARTVNVASAEKPDMMRVKPGEPENSYLVDKVMGAEDIIGLPMPFGRDPLTAQEKATVVEWVKGLSNVNTAQMQSDQADPLLPFPGWKLINLPSPRTVDKGDWLFLIGHRFSDLSIGYDNFYGLDGPARMFLNLGYAITDDMFVNLGRSNNFADVELNLKYSFLEQYPGKLPLSAAVQASVNWISLPGAEGASRLRSEVLTPSLQAIVSSEVVEGYSLLFVPGIAFNPNFSVSEEDPLITLGLGGRIHLAGNIALIGEWVPIVSGFTHNSNLNNRFDSWGGGMEIFLRGHVFQIFVSNALGLTTAQYMSGGDLDVRDGNLRLGFNIFRQLSF